MAGLSEIDNQFIFDKLINPLKARGCKIFLFGSRATGKFKKFSDIDLIFYTPKEQTKLSASEVFELITFIEESTFIYKVDLVNEQDLAAGYKEKAEQIEL